MKQSFFIGFLATLGLAGSAEQSYSSSSASSQSTATSVSSSRGLGSTSTSSASVASGVSSAISFSKAAQGSTSNQSIDSLFLRLPSSKELDRLILAADSVALLKTIQTVATDDSLTCDQRIAYLLQVLGRIRAAAEKKQFAADQLKVIIDGANAQIKRLQGEISRLQGEIKGLWLDEIAKNLADATAKLETLYNSFNSAESNIAPNEAKVAGYEKQIAILTSANDAERNRSSNDRLKLAQVEATIRGLEIQLADTKAKESALIASIKKSQDAIASNDKRVSDIRSKIKQLEDEIKRVRDKIDALKAKYNDLEIETERLRTDIAIAETKADRYRAQIRDFEAKISTEKKKLVTTDLNNLQDGIKTLQRFIPTVQAEIDRHYYNCYGNGSVEVVTTGSVVVYIVRGEAWGDYIRGQYGAGTVTESLRATGTLELKRVDIFGPVWSARVGYPFPSSSLGGSDFSVSGSFSCLNPNEATQGSGRITEVGADYIRTSSGATLNLGSCSRVQSTSEIPTIGQNIAYKAVPSGAQGFNLYQATCW